ncbi:PEBP-like protein [Aureobasidium pullulans]|nr:PEBP-like protein [Aureobasidium pullulans]
MRAPSQKPRVICSQQLVTANRPLYRYRAERRLLRTRGLTCVGSRRRRVATLSSSRIPFEQLPLQCFQEARKVLNQHRQKKVEDIEAERQKIARLETAPVEPQNKQQHQHRIDSMECYLGTTPDSRRHQRPHGQEEKWRQYARMIIMQRITQMDVVPDVLPAIDPTLNVDISFDPHDVQPGGFVDSRVSEFPAHLNIQP